MSKLKTWAPGDALTAADVNSILSPDVPGGSTVRYEKRTLPIDSPGLFELWAATAPILAIRDGATVTISFDLKAKTAGSSDAVIASGNPWIPPGTFAFVPVYASSFTGTGTLLAYAQNGGLIRMRPGGITWAKDARLSGTITYVLDLP